MINRPLDYLYIAATIGLTVYGQVALKWRMDREGPLPPGFAGALGRLFVLLFDPIVASAFFAAFLASLAWMAVSAPGMDRRQVAMVTARALRDDVAEPCAPAVRKGANECLPLQRPTRDFRIS